MQDNDKLFEGLLDSIEADDEADDLGAGLRTEAELASESEAQRDALEALARELGVKFRSDISSEKLNERVVAAMAEANESPAADQSELFSVNVLTLPQASGITLVGNISPKTLAEMERGQRALRIGR